MSCMKKVSKKIIMPNNITLLAENYLLKKKLETLENQLKREVSGQQKKIASEKSDCHTQRKKSSFLADNIEEIVTKKIQDFFGEIMLINIPSAIIENIISAEITYYNFRHMPQADWFAVISSYHKALDIIVEEYITSIFRNFIDINKIPHTFENNVLEKTLYSVITKKYVLSAGKLFHIIETIQNSKKDSLPHFMHLFRKFLWLNREIKQLLLKDKNFYTILKNIIESEVLWEKRHKGRITFVETREARKLLIWEFRDKECLIYKLMLLGEI